MTHALWTVLGIFSTGFVAGFVVAAIANVRAMRATVGGYQPTHLINDPDAPPGVD